MHARAPATSPDGHLYIAVNEPHTGAGIVLRYPLFGGIPSRTPDLRYGHAGDPISAGADGTFYAGVPFECCEGVQKVVAFAANSNQPARRITLPYVQSDGTEALAMTVDANDYLYVAYAPLFSGVRGRYAAMAPAASKLPAAGVAVYSPTQHGNARPVQAMQVRAVTSPSQVNEESIALGPDGNLDVLISDLPNELISFSNPLTNPQIARILQLPNLIGDSLAVPLNDTRMYLLALNASGKTSEIDVYRDRARGQMGPERVVVLPFFAFGLSIRGDIIYTISEHSLAGFQKSAMGSPSPIFTLALPPHMEPLAMTTGP